MRAHVGAMLLLGGLVLVGATGCIDAARVNTECRWSDAGAEKLDLSRSSDREHLRMDVKVAGELGVRMADVKFRNRPDLNEPIQLRCREALLDSIVQRHGVTRANIAAAATDRVWWADILVVFLPMAIVVGFVMDRVTRRICRSFEPDDATIATISLLALIPIVALLGMGLAQFWSFSAESAFLRNGHVSFRAFEIPAIAHGWITFFAALVLCASTALWRFRMTSLAGSNDNYAARHVRLKRAPR
jgi:hypothetical protein